MTVAEVLQQAQRLSVRERKELVKLLIDTLDAPVSGETPRKKHSILEFAGIGAHLADSEDPQDYINHMRSEWDERP